MTDAAGGVDAGAAHTAHIWLSMAEIGRRQSPPVSREAVRKRVDAFVQRGMLSTREGPRGAKLVNVVAYDRLVANETDPAQALRNERDAPPPPTRSPAVESEAPSPDAGSFSSSRAVREGYQAENARLDLEERLSRLADRDETVRLTTDIFRRLRDRLLSMPARVAERLAAAPDAQAIRAHLMTEMRQELDGFARHLDELETGTEASEDDDDPFERDAEEQERSSPEA